MENDRYVDRKNEIPEDFYSTTYATDRMLGFLKGRTEEQKKQPFFAYLAYLAPHWPLQAPKERSDRYAGWYNDGPDKLSERRVKRLIELGLVPADVVPAKPEGLLGKEWADLTHQERAESSRKMEVYAAMVEMIDEGVGQVIDYLESTGELENTFVTFISDNGAEGLMMEALQLMGSEGTMADIIEAYYTNTLENIGAHDSFVWYGPRWASAATAPSRGWKVWPTEGGIRCPCIVRYPGFQSQPKDAVTHQFTTVMDILPTIAELAGVQLPQGQFHGREVVPVRGKSWNAHLSSSNYEATTVHDENHVHGWELVGLRAIRKGNWKAVWMHEPRGRGEWELYNVEKDPGELIDLAKLEKDILKDLIFEWERYYAETGMFEIPFEFSVAKA